MTSIRARLFLLLTAATGLVWLLAAIWISVNTQRELGRTLDARLVEAGRMVASLIAGQHIAPGTAAQISLPPPSGYARQLSCQIWSFDGRLLGRSSGAPVGELTTSGSGLSETVIDGERWRVFAIEDPAQRVRILVGDNLKVRDRLARNVILGLLLPAALVLPVLAGLIWLCVGRGLAPLRHLAEALASRDAEDFRSIQLAVSPTEIGPVLRALNGLLARVAEARERERHFTAFAAHELRTPLAGLRTQAQVALAARDEAMRTQALRQILVAVDRTTRLVRQLLDLSRLEAESTIPPAEQVDLGPLLIAVGQEMAPLCRTREVTLAAARDLGGVQLLANEALLFTALRNLAENAVQHSPSGGRVTLSLGVAGAEAALAIEDNGPGIPADELDLVRRRFFRGRQRSGPGSGLGLSIAELALHRCGAELRLRNRESGGLRAEAVFKTACLHRPTTAPQPLVLLQDWQQP